MNEEQNNLRNALKAWALGEAVRCASCGGPPEWASVSREILSAIDRVSKPILDELGEVYKFHTGSVKIRPSVREEWGRAMEREKHKKPAEGSILQGESHV
jgi:hypothetical protein